MSKTYMNGKEELENQSGGERELRSGRREQRQQNAAQNCHTLGSVTHRLKRMMNEKSNFVF